MKYIDELVERHAKGDRSPTLLRELTLLAWQGFHEVWEPSPLVDDTEEQREFALLRTEPALADKTEDELRQVLREDPMLLAHLGIERMLEAQLYWPKPPPNPSKLPLPKRRDR